jgi:hypothetical protein
VIFYPQCAVPNDGTRVQRRISGLYNDLEYKMESGLLLMLPNITSSLVSFQITSRDAFTQAEACE